MIGDKVKEMGGKKKKQAKFKQTAKASNVQSSGDTIHCNSNYHTEMWQVLHPQGSTEVRWV